MGTEIKTVKDTSKKEIERLFQLQREHQYSYGNQPIRDRIKRLDQLKKTVEKYRSEIHQAVYNDFRKHHTEVDATELLPIFAEIKHAKRHIRSWTSRQKVTTPLSLLGSSSYILHEPKGVSLIIAPWNFPIMLTLAPLIGAISAGCPAILKPSENTPHSSKVLRKIVSEAFEEHEVSLVEGGIQTSTDLLSFPFNHIYFTGAPSIGKIIMGAAAKHLSSVTLELGGKSPVIVDATANLNIAAKRIAWAKFLNAGQICIAPDYLIVENSIKNKLLDKVKTEVNRLFSENQESSDSYVRMVNQRHFDRVNGYLKDAIDKNGNFEMGGKVDRNDNYIQPTIVSNLDDDALLMQEEVFGPVLPVVTFDKISEVPDIIQSREKPLALYIYSKKNKNIKFLLDNTRAGGTGINHSIVHIFNAHLPFGGSNNSGIGKGMGHYGFLEFTNRRGVLKQHLGISAADLIAPPYTKLKDRIIKITERWLT